MRYATLLLLAVLAACGQPRVKEGEQGLVCHATLLFPSDDARMDFLSRNAEQIAQRTSQEHLMLASSHSRPIVHIVTTNAACPRSGFDRAYGLDGVDALSIATEFASIENISSGFARDEPNVSSWDQDHVRQCVVRIGLERENRHWAVMRVLVSSGLRDAFVHRDNDGIVCFGG